VYDNETAKAVKLFQQSYALEILSIQNFTQATGVWGEKTAQKARTLGLCGDTVVDTVTPANQLSCTVSLYLTKAVRFGANNNKQDVMLLEKFLNTYEGANLTVDGIYSVKDRNAVIAWQEKYRADILTPWNLTKGTGYVYITSLKKIKELHESQCSTGTTQSVTTSCFAYTRNLERGSSGTEVRKLQNLLSDFGFLKVAPNGNYGPSTQAAVRAFQSQYAIPQTGIVGPLTAAQLSVACRAGSTTSVQSTTTTSVPQSTSAQTVVRTTIRPTICLSDTIEPGTTSEDVLKIQKFLESLGFMTVPGNSHYGIATQNAVTAFQEKYRDEILTPGGLSKPTGVWGYYSAMKASDLGLCTFDTIEQ
jgi:peptidoglycan hydrolase-like protein with peptidoglycan-binding domain